MNLAIAPIRRPATTSRAALVMAAVDEGFLTSICWDPDARTIVFPQQHPQLGWRPCRVQGCGEATTASTRLCSPCGLRWKRDGRPLEEYAAVATKDSRADRLQVGTALCRVPGCQRIWRSSTTELCTTHEGQQQRRRLSLEDFIQQPGIRPLAAYGPCSVIACGRQRQGTNSVYCSAHAARLSALRRKGLILDEDHWRRTEPPVSSKETVSLRGLPDLVTAELLFGLQERTRSGRRTAFWVFRPVCTALLATSAASLLDLDAAPLGRGSRDLVHGFTKAVALVDLSPETERHKDTWDCRAFGCSGFLRFAGIRQTWLREAMKRWAYDDLPRRRGDNPGGTVQDIINSMAQFSDSLRLQRPDDGTSPTSLSRLDITAFTNRLAYLQEQEKITAYRRLTVSRHVRRCLNRMRALGLTRPHEPLHGLPDDVVLREEDIPDEPEDTEAGRDLPDEVMRVVVAELPRLDDRSSPEMRTAVEILIDTGRRPGEVCKLPWDCLDRDDDGHPVLIYSNHKGHRLGRRLPIAQETAELILRQQQRVRERFPHTPQKELKLLPSAVISQEGRRSITPGWLSDRHRTWVDEMPVILIPIPGKDGRPTMVPFDKDKIFLYAYRHSYAQRHADAGVPVDVLKELMSHRQLSTTQGYYRVSEVRRREAVDRVTAMQFDRHGNRIWRKAQALLDSERARRAIGEVAVPYGVCTEPSNVAAGGKDCPVRFRCVGCGHFRTDASYLPDLEAYLGDLLRNRERLAAALDADDWAKAEAMPSDEEITRVRRLIRRVRTDLDDLLPEERAQLDEAIALVRRGRQPVHLGMPQVRQPRPDFQSGLTS
ncbi:site-specific integrase [Streptomyces antimycoticus]|uniref:tyrosine-type recombinase/integrase n=1 Tax=Streptomyces antimycoticus TaxID=68175 RepID=UPI003444E7BB